MDVRMFNKEGETTLQSVTYADSQEIIAALSCDNFDIENRNVNRLESLLVAS